MLESFYRKFDPHKTAAEIHADLEEFGFDDICASCDRRYHTDPRQLWVQQKHGHNTRNSPRARSATRQRDPSSGKWLYGTEASGEEKRARDVCAKQKPPTGLVLRDKHMEDAKKKMKAAFYTTKPNKITREKIEEELERGGFHDGYHDATAEQIEQAKRNIILGPREVDMSGPSWIDKLFRMKDRDRSGTLDFGEFKGIVRRYGKVNPKMLSDGQLREVYKQVDTDKDGQIDPYDFEDFLMAPPSRRLLAWLKSQGSKSGQPGQLQVRALGKDDRDKLWSTYDWNKNHKLSVAEIDKALRSHPPSGWKGLTNKKALLLAFKTADQDWSGYVTRREFNKLLKYIVYFHMLWDKFDGLDADGDHRLDLGEFERCCRQLGVGDRDGDGKLSKDEMREEFEGIDTNLSGYVMFDEFCTWMARMRLGDDGEDITWEQLVDDFRREKEGSTTLPDMRLEVPCKSNGILDRWQRHHFEFDVGELQLLFRSDPPLGWEGFDSDRAVLLAFTATDTRRSGGVGRERLGELLKYIVYYHVLGQQLMDADDDFAVWLGRTQCRGLDWEEIEAWFLEHQSYAERAAQGKQPYGAGRTGSSARRQRNHPPSRSDSFDLSPADAPPDDNGDHEADEMKREKRHTQQDDEFDNLGRTFDAKAASLDADITESANVALNAELASQKRLVAELQQQMVQQQADAQAQMQQQMMAMQQQFQEQMQQQMQQAQSMQMQQMQQVQSMQAQTELDDVREPAMDRPTNADNLQRFLLSRTWRVAAVTSEEDAGSSGLLPAQDADGQSVISGLVGCALIAEKDTVEVQGGSAEWRALHSFVLGRPSGHWCTARKSQRFCQPNLPCSKPALCVRAGAAAEPMSEEDSVAVRWDGHSSRLWSVSAVGEHGIELAGEIFPSLPRATVVLERVSESDVEQMASLAQEQEIAAAQEQEIAAAQEQEIAAAQRKVDQAESQTVEPRPAEPTVAAPSPAAQTPDTAEPQDEVPVGQGDLLPDLDAASSPATFSRANARRRRSQQRDAEHMTKAAAADVGNARQARLDQIAREKQETRKADVRARGKSRLQVQRGRRREAPKPTDVLQRLASSAPDLVEASPARDTLNSR